MAKFDDGTDNVTVFDATLYNNVVRSVKNTIENSGQTIDATNIQMSKAVAAYGGGGNFYTESGTANAYVLAPKGSFQSPNAYFDGMTVKFRAANSNTGASTINVNTLGVKNIKKEDGSTDPAAGDISTSIDSELRYDGTNFILAKIGRDATTTSKGLSQIPKIITIANNSLDANHDMDFTAGNFIFDDGSGQANLSATTKRFDATFALGSGNGGMVSGESLPNQNDVYLYAISNASGSVTDAIGTTTKDGSTISGDSVVSANSLTKKKYIGAFHTDSSSNIRAGTYSFNPDGSYSVIYPTQIFEEDVTDPGTSAVTKELTAPAGTVAFIDFNIFDDSAATLTTFCLVTSISQSDVIPSSSRFSLLVESSDGSNASETTALQVKLDASSNIRYRLSTSNSDIRVRIFTKGWYDSII